MFPLAGALLLRGWACRSTFSSRAISGIDRRLGSRPGHRLVGMIQPVSGASISRTSRRCSRSAASAASPRSPSPATAAISTSSLGRAASQSTGAQVATAYRQCRVTYHPFADDFIARKGEDEVDRKAVLEALTSFLKANNLKTDWQGVESAPNEALVNALAMMSPYGTPEKQALLEAPDLKSRAEILVAVTEMELAKKTAGGGEPPLQ